MSIIHLSSFYVSCLVVFKHGLLVTLNTFWKFYLFVCMFICLSDLSDSLYVFFYIFFFFFVNYFASTALIFFINGNTLFLMFPGRYGTRVWPQIFPPNKIILIREPNAPLLPAKLFSPLMAFILGGNAISGRACRVISFICSVAFVYIFSRANWKNLFDRKIKFSVFQLCSLWEASKESVFCRIVQKKNNIRFVIKPFFPF